MGLKNSIDQLDATLGNGLHEIESLTGDIVYFHLASAMDTLKYQREIDAGELSRGAIKVALTRARDEDGRLVWPKDSERKQLLESTKQIAVLRDIGAKILNYERNLTEDNLPKTASGN